MSKSAMIRARTEPSLKAEAEKVLHKLGLTLSEAINLFFAQVSLRQAIPFEVALPTKTTLKAMKDAREGRTQKAKTKNELFKKLGM